MADAIIQILKHIIYTMLIVIGLAAIVSAFGCGRNEKDGNDGQSAQPCTVTKANGEATITCPDGSSATVSDGENGTDGKDGAPGSRGANGMDGRDGVSTVAIEPCPTVSEEDSELFFCVGNTLYVVSYIKPDKLSLWMRMAGPYIHGQKCHFEVIKECELS